MPGTNDLAYFVAASVTNSQKKFCNVENRRGLRPRGTRAAPEGLEPGSQSQVEAGGTRFQSCQTFLSTLMTFRQNKIDRLSRESLPTGRISMIDLLVLTSSYHQLLLLKILFFVLHNKLS